MTDSHSKLKVLDEMTRQPLNKGMPKYFYFLPILHLLIAVPLAFYLNIWVDEASTLYTTNNGFFQTLQNTLWTEKQAPFYFLVLSLWREINDSIFFAKLFSIIFSLLSIVIFFQLVRKFWNEKTAAFATFFLAIHPYLIWASLEIRLYSLVILLSLLLIKLFFDGYFERRQIQLEQQKKIRNTQILFIIVAVISLYTNYYLGFLLVGFFVVLIVLRRWQAAKKYFWQMLMVGIAILPLLWIIKIQVAMNTKGEMQPTNFIEGIKVLWNHFLTFVLPTELYTPENQTAFSFVRVWLIRILGLILLVFLLIKRKLLEGKILIFGIISAVVFAFLYFTYFMLSGVYVQIRHAAVWFIPVCFLTIAVITASLPNKYKVQTVAAIAVLLSVFYAYGISALYPEFVKAGDWERIAEFVETKEKPNQPIIIFSTYDAISLPFYYQGKNKILPDKDYFRWSYVGFIEDENFWREQIDYTISLIPKDAEEIWLVNKDVCEEAKACVPLEKFVKENYNIVEEKDFYKEQVRLLRKK